LLWSGCGDKEERIRKMWRRGAGAGAGAGRGAANTNIRLIWCLANPVRS